MVYISNNKYSLLLKEMKIEMSISFERKSMLSSVDEN